MSKYYMIEYPGKDEIDILEFIEEHPQGKFTYVAKQSFKQSFGQSTCDVAKIECRLMATSKTYHQNLESVPAKMFFHKAVWIRAKRIEVKDFPIYSSLKTLTPAFTNILKEGEPNVHSN